MDNQTVTTTTEAEFEPLRTLLPVALQAVNLNPEEYPVSIEDGKGERELHMKNQFRLTIRLVLQSTDEPPLYVLLVAKPPTLHTLVPYATKPYKVDAETLCCHLAHSLSPRPSDGGRALSKTAVEALVREAIAQHRQERQSHSQAAVLGTRVALPTAGAAVLGSSSQDGKRDQP